MTYVSQAAAYWQRPPRHASRPNAGGPKSRMCQAENRRLAKISEAHSPKS
jgi:hypothetical protein